MSQWRARTLLLLVLGNGPVDLLTLFAKVLNACKRPAIFGSRGRRIGAATRAHISRAHCCSFAASPQPASWLSKGGAQRAGAPGCTNLCTNLNGFCGQKPALSRPSATHPGEAVALAHTLDAQPVVYRARFTNLAAVLAARPARSQAQLERVAPTLRLTVQGYHTAICMVKLKKEACGS